MWIRNGVILSLTLLGVILLVVMAHEDRQGAELIAGMGCFLLAAVYWGLNRDR